MVDYSRILKKSNWKVNKLVIIANITIAIPLFLFLFFSPDAKSEFSINFWASISSIGFGALFTYFIIDYLNKEEKKRKYQNLKAFYINSLAIIVNNIFENFICNMKLDSMTKTELSWKIEGQEQLSSDDYEVIKTQLIEDIHNLEGYTEITILLGSNKWNIDKLDEITRSFILIEENSKIIDMLSSLNDSIMQLSQFSLLGKNSYCCNPEDMAEAFVDVIRSASLLLYKLEETDI